MQVVKVLWELGELISTVRISRSAGEGRRVEDIE